VLLYEALTGRPPFNHARVRDLLVAHASQKPVPPSQLAAVACAVPARLERLILSCLEKDPALRPETMGAIHAELTAIAAELVAPPPPVADRRPESRASHAAWWSARQGAALAAGVSALLGLSIVRWSPDRSARPTTAVTPPPAVLADEAAPPLPITLPPAPAANTARSRTHEATVAATLGRLSIVGATFVPRPAAASRPLRVARAVPRAVPRAVSPVASLRPTVVRLAIKPRPAPRNRLVVKGARARPSRLEWIAAVRAGDRSGAGLAPAGTAGRRSASSTAVAGSSPLLATGSARSEPL
jgi:hypothetical protein